MYCGDETGSFIGELTSSSCRFGYGGDDCPKSVLSSFMYRDGTTSSTANIVIPTTTHHHPYYKRNKYLQKDSHSIHVASEEEGGGIPLAATTEDIVPIFQTYPSHVGNNAHTTTTSSSSCFFSSSTNPWDYLNNGIIENFDAWENAWEKAFQQLHVRSLYKHTKGGTMVTSSSKPKRPPPIHSSGLASATVSPSSSISIGNTTQEGEIIHPILAIDHGHTHFQSTGDSNQNNLYNESLMRKQKVHMLEILHESLCAPATFIAPSPMLASFANGRQTSLVVDIGAGGTRVTPIVDGLILQQAQRRNGRGGDWMCAIQEQVVVECMRKKMAKDTNGMQSGEDAMVVPRYAVGMGFKDLEKVRNSVFHKVAVRDCMYEMRTAPHVGGVAVYRNDEWTDPFVVQDESATGIDGDAMSEKMDVDGHDDDKSNATDEMDDSDDEDVSYEIKSKRYYTLPDGTRVNLKKNKDLCRLDELLFASELPYSSNGSSCSCSSADTLSNLPIHELIKDSLMAVSDADVRKELCGNIILTGAASLVPNIEQRLSLEVQYLVPGMYKCKLIATRNTTERRFASWIGGSVLTSLGSFQQLWLSKKEYEEYGPTLGSQRFP
jgi:Actin and related proteins